MNRLLLSAAVLLAGSALVMAETERREVGPHVHGAGTLAIAIEADKVSMDLSAPANDIVGFEHQPSTPEQTQTLASAKAALAEPFKLVELPAAAGCTAGSANVVFNAADLAAADASQHQHADFDVDYVITCKAPEKITSLSFPYFKQFAGAQKLTVTVVSDQGQLQFEVSRDNPIHALK